ncbi:MFS transporter [Weissella muntiaci]|uniref:MFS transporter n=1 Tax=Weissella muntiaci TaxID=2508881 RepID=A0A6C2C3P6_9LACO|nr:MFS transporter [Weissella muntiaci]TYC47855.1 MFS transporter [Weissella muntiaci]
MRKWVVVLTLGIFFFMVIVDGTIVNIAIPEISRDMGVPTFSVTRLVLIYLLVISTFLLFFGQLADQKGKVRIFQIGAFIFTVGSLISGYTVNFETIIIGRIVQALGASMTMATSYAIVTDTFPVEKLGRALAVESLFISLGALAGPGLGGLVLKYLPWGYIFWMNIPIGVIALVLSFFAFKNDYKRTNAKLDFRGLSTLILIGTTFYLFDSLLSSNRLLSLTTFVVMIILIQYFYKSEKVSKVPLWNFDLFTTKGVGNNLIASFAFYIGSYFYPLLAPLYLQIVLRINVSTTGLFLMVMPIVTLLVSPYIGFLTDKYDKTLLMQIGLATISATTVGLIVTNKAEKASLFFVIWSAVMAIGTAMFTNPNNTMIMARAKNEVRGVTGATNSMMRELGMMLGSFLGPEIFYKTISILEHKSTQNLTDIPNNFIILGQTTAYFVTLLIFFIVLIFVRRDRKIS